MNDSLLCIGIKFVPKCCIPWINVHARADPIVEISRGNIPLKDDLSTAWGVLVTKPLQRNRNRKAYSYRQWRVSRNIEVQLTRGQGRPRGIPRSCVALVTNIVDWHRIDGGEWGCSNGVRHLSDAMNQLTIAEWWVSRQVCGR